MLTAWSFADRLTAIAARLKCLLRAAPKRRHVLFSAPMRSHECVHHGRFEIVPNRHARI